MKDVLNLLPSSLCRCPAQTKTGPDSRRFHRTAL